MNPIAFSFASIVVFTLSRRCARSKTFYYFVGAAIGAFVGVYFVTRNRDQLKYAGVLLNLIGWFAFPWIDIRFQFAYVGVAAFCGFCAAHVHLHDFNPDSPHADVAKWTLWVLALFLAFFGKQEINVAFAIVYVVRRCTVQPDDSDTESIDSEPTQEEIKRQRDYY